MDKKIAKRQVLEAKGLIDYAEDGIVSKEFIHSNAGSITLFAIDEGQKLSEHTAPFDAVIEVVDGEAEIVIEGEAYHPKAGEMIIIPQGAVHAVNALQRFKMMLTMIRG
jgi:quercetin dioxygenase-like cupin family protein